MDYNENVIETRAEELSPVRVSELGFHCVNDKYIFIAGDVIIGDIDDQKVVIDEKLSRFKLEYDSEKSEEEAYREMLNFMYVEQGVSDIVMIYVISGLLKSLYKDAGVALKNILYLRGDSQTRKTTLACLQSQIYSCKSELRMNCRRIDSSYASIEQDLTTYKDAVFVYDDLYRESSAVTRRKNEENLKRILRECADDNGRQTMKGAAEINAQVIVTAEYLIDGLTNVGRLIFIDVKRPINSDKLLGVQRQNLSIPTFVRFFIKWVCDNYGDIVDYVKDNIFSETVNILKTDFSRLNESCRILLITLSIIIEYGKEKGIVGKDEARKVAIDVRKNLKKAFDYQENIASYLKLSEENNKKHNLSRCLLRLINSGVIKPKKGTKFFVKKGYYYITCSYLGEVLNDEFKINYSSKMMSKYFSDRRISKSEGDKKVVQYKINKHNIRFLKLNISALKEDALSMETDIENLFI